MATIRRRCHASPREIYGGARSLRSKRGCIAAVALAPRLLLAEAANGACGDGRRSFQAWALPYRANAREPHMDEELASLPGAIGTDGRNNLDGHAN
jgi:hypothetical protein